ncbi:hypothetical protein BP5796_09702 [Coleophoma crateriformis]|uniref:Uncharacterized protein n=1 Tax=Coleophoma crateriformis TaxID=565419 RepID=A0A3D8QYP8_9HELO|nr:hypothetical protein BP5796_09702 [Coleophoma crateriformis]
MYWDGLSREISHLILAYQEIHRYQPDHSVYEAEHMDLGGERFKRFCKIWIPNTGGKPSLDPSSICHQAICFAQARYASVDIRYRLARCLLQALGILDIDHVHTSMGSSIVGRHNHHPQSEVVSLDGDLGSILREMLCGSCLKPLRGYFYYECEKRCMVRCRESLHFEDQNKGKTSLQDLPEQVRERILNVPFRLCANCIESPGKFGECERDHLRKCLVNKRKAKGQSAFESRLRDRELQDHNIANPTFRRVANKMVDPSRYANAGPIHFGMMFGPLLIENGVPDTSSGAVISGRPLPSLCLKPQEALLYDTDQCNERTDLEVRIFDDKISSERKLDQVLAVSRERHFLGSVKKIYGGAFSGHAEAFRDLEQEIIKCFVKTADSFQYLPGKAVLANQKRLFRLSALVVSKIQEIFGQEVKIYLQHFANALASPSTPIRWDLDTNNCQHFAQNLLKGLNTSTLFHLIPGNYFDDETVKQKKKWPIPRYLLSFGHDIDTPIALLRPQVRSLVWNFYHQKRDDCDMIEFAERFRTEACVAPTEAWEILCGFTPEFDATTKTHKLSVIDALWTIPRDSISILQTHLMRSWARHSTNGGRCLSPKEWVLNRLRILHQLDVFACLSSGLATATLLELGTHTEFLSSYYYPTATSHGTLHVSEKIVNYHGIRFIMGRERDWWNREMKHMIYTMTKSLKPSHSNPK